MGGGTACYSRKTAHHVMQTHAEAGGSGSLATDAGEFGGGARHRHPINASTPREDGAAASGAPFCRGYFPYWASILAARMKSLSVRPSILWVQVFTPTLPQAR